MEALGYGGGYTVVGKWCGTGGLQLYRGAVGRAMEALGYGVSMGS